MIGVYYGIRIYKTRDYEIEKGDIGYLKDQDIPETIRKVRILLSEIVVWEEYTATPDVPYYKNKQHKVRVTLKATGEDITLIEDISKFDKVMDEYLDFINNNNIFKTHN